MSTLTIVANIIAKADKLTALKSALETLAKNTRTEAGCVNYILHQSNKDELHFMFYETWQSRQAWLLHMDGENIKAYLAVADNLVNSFTVDEFTELN
tara:strand:- start:339 stop:629 length:291 start_codon:yes stop_codon:yes gene_type:complete